MRTIRSWLDEYHESHQHFFNKLMHWICVPLIVMSLLGLLWSINPPAVFSSTPIPFNWVFVLIVPALLYYFILSYKLALGMIIVSTLMVSLLYWMNGLQTPLWLISVIVFIVAWVGQFIGHYVEGKRPSFFKDIQFLLIGPLWLLSFIYRKLGIHY